MWILGLKGLKCTHPPNSPQDLPSTYFLLVGIAFACSLHEPKDRGKTKMKYPNIAHSTTLVRLKLFHLHLFVFVCLLAVADFFPISHNVKIYRSFSAIFARSRSRIKKGTSPRNRRKSRTKNRPGKQLAHFS